VLFLKKLTSSTHKIGINTVVKFSVNFILLIFFKNILNCILFPPLKGIPLT
uniref:Uncharacterized protein n=1 Tax=Megaselia scalaris TaxID=36166 RepID=T1H699_MEGSC